MYPWSGVVLGFAESLQKKKLKPSFIGRPLYQRPQDHFKVKFNKERFAHLANGCQVANASLIAAL